MKTAHVSRTTIRLAALFLVLGLILASCAPFGSTTRLRVMNAGTVPIQNLTILFPDEEVTFGNVPAGATTDYQRVGKGVYSYAAYRFELAGSNVTQPVLDWMGAQPITDGEAFTYVVDLDPTRDPMQLIQVREVSRDD